MNTRSTIGLLLTLSLGLNVPGLIALAGTLFEPLGILTLVVLPLVVLWGLPGLMFHSIYPDAFRITEFGVYPDAVSGWILMFGFWMVTGLIATASYRKLQARLNARHKI